MQKRFLLFIAFTIALALFVINLKHILPARAEQVDVYENQRLVKSVVFKIGVPYYVVNGQTPGVKLDVAPFIREGRTFVPVRFLGNALGLEDSKITWDNDTRTATMRGKATLQMTIGKPRVISNGQAKDIDAAPVLTNDRTFLPARYVAEGLGYEVGWDGATQTVVCWPAGRPKPDVSAAVDYLNGVQQPQEKPSGDGKPEIARQLEQMFGVAMKPNGSSWAYFPPREKTMREREYSYFVLSHTPETGHIGVQISWDLINSAIRNVEIDLSPIEKVLSWKFPDQPDKVKEIMDHARQVAEKTREVWVQWERLPNKTFYLDGYKVLIVSAGNAFVSAHISKN